MNTKTDKSKEAAAFAATGTDPVHVLSIEEMRNKIPDEAAAIAYLEKERRGDGRHCVRCGCADRITPQRKHPGRCRCGACRKYFTARTGTPLEYMKVSCRAAVLAGHMMATHPRETSSLALSRELGISQPATWYLLRRLRRAAGTAMDAVK